MADFMLKFDPVAGVADLCPSAAGNDFAIDYTLTPFVLLAIGLDRQADDDDVLPGDPAPGNSGTVNLLARDRRGWFGDWLAPGTPVGNTQPPRYRYGCRDWIYLSRANRTPETLRRAIESWQEALQPLVDIGVAQSVTVTGDYQQDPAGNWYLARQAVIKRPNGSQETHRYDLLWGQPSVPGAPASTYSSEVLDPFGLPVTDPFGAAVLRP
jgi:phage gp46-like protein